MSMPKRETTAIFITIAGYIGSFLIIALLAIMAVKLATPEKPAEETSLAPLTPEPIKPPEPPKPPGPPRATVEELLDLGMDSWPKEIGLPPVVCEMEFTFELVMPGDRSPEEIAEEKRQQKKARDSMHARAKEKALALLNQEFRKRAAQGKPMSDDELEERAVDLFEQIVEEEEDKAVPPKEETPEEREEKTKRNIRIREDFLRRAGWKLLADDTALVEVSGPKGGDTVKRIREFAESGEIKLRRGEVRAKLIEDDRHAYEWHQWKPAIVYGSEYNKHRIESRDNWEAGVSKIAVSEAFVQLAKEKDWNGLEFVWVPDEGPYAAKQWFQIFCENSFGKHLDHPCHFDPNPFELKDERAKARREGVNSMSPKYLGRLRLLSEYMPVELFDLNWKSDFSIQFYRSVLRRHAPDTDFAFGRHNDICVRDHVSADLIARGFAAEDEFEPILVQETLLGDQVDWEEAYKPEFNDKQKETIRSWDKEAQDERRLRQKQYEEFRRAPQRPQRKVDFDDLLRRIEELFQFAKKFDAATEKLEATNPNHALLTEFEEMSRSLPTIDEVLTDQDLENLREKAAKSPETFMPMVLKPTSGGAVEFDIPSKWLAFLRLCNRGCCVDALHNDLYFNRLEDQIGENWDYILDEVQSYNASIGNHYLHVADEGSGDYVFLDLSRNTLDGDCAVCWYNHETAEFEIRGCWPSIPEFLEDTFKDSFAAQERAKKMLEQIQQDGPPADKSP